MADYAALSPSSPALHPKLAKTTQFCSTCFQKAVISTACDISSATAGKPRNDRILSNDKTQYHSRKVLLANSK
jgi:hypothetical protein